MISFIYIVSLSLSLLERSATIDCPGNTISYSCSITSNSDSITLIWTLLIPGLDVISSEFGAESALNESRTFGPNVSFTLTEYVNGEHIVSILVFTVGMNVDINQTSISCEIPSLATDTIDLKINSARKL